MRFNLYIFTSLHEKEHVDSKYIIYFIKVNVNSKHNISRIEKLQCDLLSSIIHKSLC